MTSPIESRSPTFPNTNLESQKSRIVLGKDDFLKLLVTQLKYQDPLNPLEQHEFAAHLAQFSQLEQLSNIGTGIQGLKTGMTEESKLQAISMIGKKIEASGNEVNLVQGSSVGLKPSLGAEARPLRATIYNGMGQAIRELDLSTVQEGKAIEWDGRDQSGAAMPSGKYSFRVVAIGKDGMVQEVGSELSGRVLGVDFDAQTPILVVQTGSGNSKVELSKVRVVSIDSDIKAKEAISAGSAQLPELARSSVPLEQGVVAQEPDEIWEPPSSNHGYFNQLMER